MLSETCRTWGMSGMATTDYTCAVWYLDNHGQIDYDLFADETTAANSAACYDGTVLGLQWADRTTVACADWAAFAAAKQRKAKRWEELRYYNPPVPTPTRRRIYDPFTDSAIHVETSEPDWLGERPATERAPKIGDTTR